MANRAKKFEFDAEDDDERPAYIDWQEFNRLIRRRNDVPEPEEDSKDDAAVDELRETLLGKDYLEEPREDSVVLADTPSGARDEDNLLEDRTEGRTAESSPRPEPKNDTDADSSTH